MGDTNNAGGPPSSTGAVEAIRNSGQASTSAMNPEARHQNLPPQVPVLSAVSSTQAPGSQMHSGETSPMDLTIDTQAIPPGQDPGFSYSDDTSERSNMADNSQDSLHADSILSRGVSPQVTSNLETDVDNGRNVQPAQPKPLYSHTVVHNELNVQMTWREARESTVVFQLNYGKVLDPDKLYEWMLTLPINVHHFKPVSCGSVNRGKEYHVTFRNKEIAFALVQACKGQLQAPDGSWIAKVSLTHESISIMRLHWLPPWIENEKVSEALQRELSKEDQRIKVLSVNNGKISSPWGGSDIKTTYRTATVVFPLSVHHGVTPGIIEVEGDDKNYQALVSVFGLPPLCFKCKKRGHTSKECPYPCIRCKNDGNTKVMWDHMTSEHEEYITVFQRQRMQERQAMEEEKSLEKSLNELIDEQNSKRTGSKKDNKSSPKNKRKKNNSGSSKASDDDSLELLEKARNFTATDKLQLLPDSMKKPPDS